jgi:hypothetical protein
MPFMMIMITANTVSRTTDRLLFEWIITAEMLAASMAVTASVRISVPRGSPKRMARCSAWRTTHMAAPKMTQNSQTNTSRRCRAPALPPDSDSP